MKKCSAIVLCSILMSCIFLVLTGCQQKQQFAVNPQLLEWLNSVPGAVYLPVDWDPIKENTDNVYYYIKGTVIDENMQIEVYQVDKSVDFNDEDELLSKCGPVSESDFIGSITRNNTLDESVNAPLNIPHEYITIELTEDVTAYMDMNGYIAKCEDNGWKFIVNYSTPSSDANELKSIIEALADKKMLLSTNGIVEMYISNRVTINFSWNEGEYNYNFRVVGSDFDEILQSLQSFDLIKE